VKTLKKQGFEARGRNEAAGGFKRLIDQLEYFLGFIGLASLVAGGLGVAGAVSAYLEQRKPSIAVLKALGAEGGLIRNLYLIQIAVLSVLGVAIGLATFIGALGLCFAFHGLIGGAINGARRWKKFRGHSKVKSVASHFSYCAAAGST